MTGWQRLFVFFAFCDFVAAIGTKNPTLCGVWMACIFLMIFIHEEKK